MKVVFRTSLKPRFKRPFSKSAGGKRRRKEPEIPGEPILILSCYSDIMHRFGLTTNHFRDSLKYNLLITFAGICILTALGFLAGFKSFSLDIRWLVFYLFVSVPLQELIFRGFLQTRLYRIGEIKAIVLASAAFSAIHFSNILLVMLTLAAGLSWGYSFWKKPNLFGPIMSHFILGTYLFTFVL